MLQGEWRLDYPGTAFSVGGWDPVTNPFRLPRPIGLRSAPTIGDVEIATDDTARPRGDGYVMGSDYRGGRTIGFSLSCRGSTEGEALSLASQVAAAWRADTIRQTPGAYATLATSNAGRERAVFGRPRRFAQNDDARKAGLVTIECDFQTIDDRFYDLADTGIGVGFISASTSGVMTPVTTPVTTTPNTITPGAIVVGGELPVWPVIGINGPILNPVVAVAGQWVLSLRMAIVAGDTVTLDTRPWVQSVTSGSGASWAGYLARGSRLDNASLSPGAYAVSLAGVDQTGLSSMQFAWRNAYAGL